MSRVVRSLRLPAAALAAAIGVSACGSGISVSRSDPNHRGAMIFQQRCGGCHTLGAAGTNGSGVNPRDKLPTNGPNFGKRRETVQGVLYALRNGGFSGAIMPQNLVTGSDARAVAQFVASYAGCKGKCPASSSGQ
ncbi:MAG TPA: cytochrome c [Solirubrobacteraceae bacterium]|nr:cytochrome c [Solirubrobacteraceae bacterium]